MKYYKIIVDNTFIGTVNSGAFMKEHPEKHRLIVIGEEEGQFVDYNGTLYHDYWMRPLLTNTQFNYIIADIEEITVEEYEILNQAIENNEEIIIEDEGTDEEFIPVETPEEYNITVEYAREGKLKEMSRTCRTTIENGFDLELRGTVHHFSLDTQDQLNLISLSGMAQTQEYIPYHADGEECIFYTAEEMNAIVAAATAFKIYHTTYYNALKAYINSLETLEDIAAIEYGTLIPEEYQSDVLKSLQ